MPETNAELVRRAIAQAIGSSGRKKYGNEPTTVDGFLFDSKREADRYSELKRLQDAGEIVHLIADKKKLRFPLGVNGQVVAYYEADFDYLRRDGTRVVEDVKSEFTRKNRVYRLKMKLFRACYGFDVNEVL